MTPFGVMGNFLERDSAVSINSYFVLLLLLLYYYFVVIETEVSEVLL